MTRALPRSERPALVQRVAGTIDRLSGFLAQLAGVALLGMMLVVCYGVVMRYAFRAPVAWVNEFARFSFLPVVALGLAFALRQGAHVATEFFTGVLSDRARNGLRLLSVTLFFAYGVLSCWAGWRLASVAFAKALRSDEAEIPLVVVQAVIPIGFLALSLQALVETGRALLGDARQTRPSNGAHPR
ncbi:MAG: TRAP transporter small permease subunit [Candidatus Rokubacteria bacterium]|nr:TRAP transporter small permease subunit [Candidatus Rokubacteria bacterium]